MTSPEGARALVITKPGYETVRFGPLSETNAANWQQRLLSTFHNTAHPEGTEVTVEPYSPYPADAEAYIAPESIPGNVDDLMEPFRADQGYSDETFPDIYLRLIMRYGDTRADELWKQACGRCDDEGVLEEAEQAISTSAAAARAALEELITGTGVAAGEVSKMLRTGHDLEIGVPAEVATYPGDAAEHLKAAARSLRAALLCLQPARGA